MPFAIRLSSSSISADPNPGIGFHFNSDLSVQGPVSGRKCSTQRRLSCVLSQMELGLAWEETVDKQNRREVNQIRTKNGYPRRE